MIDGARHIVFFMPLLRLGGAEQLVLETVRVCRSRHTSLRFTVVTLDAQGDQMTPRLAEYRCGVIDLGARRLDPRAVFRLRHALSAARPDLLHSHLPRAGVIARLAVGRQPAVPHIYTEHNLQGAYHGLTRLLNARTLHWNTVTVAVSNAVLSDVLAVSPRLRRSTGRTRMVPNGVDAGALRRQAPTREAARHALQLDDVSPVIGVVAHFRTDKGHLVLLEALRVLNRPDLVVLFAGRDDGNEQAVRHAVTRYGLERQVRFLGFRDDVATVLASLDVVVFPSLREGLPVALLEAMALGVPVVATTAGGIPSVIRDGVSGLLCPTSDAVSLADGVARALDDRALRARMGAEGQRVVASQFELNDMVDRYAELYHELIAGA
jgi:glycosyltransferase involved in cell wall biosynthesis